MNAFERIGETMARQERDSERFMRPCAEFERFRRMLDDAGIEWWDASDLDPAAPMHRVHGEGFSVIWGRHSYGAEHGLLEARVEGAPDVAGWLTAEDAFLLVEGAVTR